MCRLDRLVCIILNDFLPFYRDWRPENRGVPHAILERDSMAHHLWENDFVKRNPDSSFVVNVPG